VWLTGAGGDVSGAPQHGSEPVVRNAVLSDEVEDGDDVAMVQEARHPRLAHESARKREVGHVLRAQLLQRDQTIEVRVAGEIDDRHSPSPDLSEKLVSSKSPREQGAFSAPWLLASRLRQQLPESATLLDTTT